MSKSKKVLIVDDDGNFIDILGHILEKASYDVFHTKEGDLLLYFVEQLNPDIILLDVNLNNYDGRILCRKMKTLKEYAHIPVILISADSKYKPNYKLYNADSFIEKSDSNTKILECISFQLNKGSFYFKGIPFNPN